MSEATTLLRGAALATAGIAAASLLSSRAAQAAAPNPATAVTLYFSAVPPAGSPNPIQIPSTSTNAGSGPVVQGLNYAFALETLEAEFYRQVIARLTGGGTDMFGNAITGLGASGTDVNLVMEFGQVENDHRDFLANTLYGTTDITKNPYIQMGLKFDFGINSMDRPTVVQTTYTVELHGVMAYSGAAPSLIGSQYLAIAAAILGTEARHTSGLAFAVNGLAGHQVVETAPLPGPPLIAGHPDENQARDDSLMPDQILWQGGDIKFPLGTIPQGGHLTPVSGPGGFVFKP